MSSYWIGFEKRAGLFGGDDKDSKAMRKVEDHFESMPKKDIETLFAAARHGPLSSKTWQPRHHSLVQRHMKGEGSAREIAAAHRADVNAYHQKFGKDPDLFDGPSAAHKHRIWDKSLAKFSF